MCPLLPTCGSEWESDNPLKERSRLRFECLTVVENWARLNSSNTGMLNLGRLIGRRPSFGANRDYMVYIPKDVSNLIVLFYSYSWSTMQDIFDACVRACSP